MIVNNENISFTSHKSTSSSDDLDILNKVTHGVKNCIKICHVNTQSLPSNFIEFVRLFSNSVFDVIVISESWLKKHHSSKTYSLFSYKLYRNDRYDKRGAGVAVYIKQPLKPKILKSSPNAYDVNQSEYMYISIATKK